MSVRPIQHYLKSGESRQIDIDNHISEISNNSEEATALCKSLFNLQVAKIAQDARAIDSLVSIQASSTEKIHNSLSEVNDNLAGMTSILTNVSDGIDALSNQLSYYFDQIGHLIENQNFILKDICNTLATPYETQSLELRKQANKWLTAGMVDSGQDQSACYDDALRLFDACIQNPIGMQDYTVWFHLGWLYWKHEMDLVKSENAFRRSQRLSKTSKDLYYLKSLRHLAYILYLQGSYTDAFETISTARSNFPDDHDTIFDYARYSSKLGKIQDAIDALDKCIDLRPATALSMFSEEDFF